MKQHGVLCDVRLICPFGVNFSSSDGAEFPPDAYSAASAGEDAVSLALPGDGGVQGAEILAHKSVLASGCAFFYAQFTSEFLASGEEQNSAANDSLIMDQRVSQLTLGLLVFSFLLRNHCE